MRESSHHQTPKASERLTKVATPRFLFTPYTNSFKVVIKNLESLSVAQIQEIEAFVLKRKGIFDFNSYSFTIQKRVSFDEFVSLLKELELAAHTTLELQPQQTQERISFGQYKGMLYSELPDSYLSWLKKNHSGYESEKIERELIKRGL